MTFQPVLPLPGVAGWTFLKRTEAAQSAAFERRAEVQRDEAYFRQKIATVKTADALVSDRRLLRVTLEAFGLETDVNAQAFIRKVLTDGTLKPEALANRLADPRYGQLATAFGFDLAVPRTVISDFADGIIARWKERRFEAGVGVVNNNFRLAMNARRELAAIAQGSGSESTKWFKIMGSAPLRTVVEAALGLPKAFVGLDLDRQLGALQDRAERVLGSASASQFSDPAKVELVVRRFLVAAESASQSSFSPTLTLLQNGAASGGVFRRL